MAQLVKNSAVTGETWVLFLGWEDPLEEGMATHSIFFPGESPWTEEPGRLLVHGVAQSQAQLSDFTSLVTDWNEN